MSVQGFLQGCGGWSGVGAHEQNALNVSELALTSERAFIQACYIVRIPMSLFLSVERLQLTKRMENQNALPKRKRFIECFVRNLQISGLL